jgi:hypothetical protein
MCLQYLQEVMRFHRGEDAAQVTPASQGAAGTQQQQHHKKKQQHKKQQHKKQQQQRTP